MIRQLRRWWPCDGRRVRLSLGIWLLAVGFVYTHHAAAQGHDAEWRPSASGTSACGSIESIQCPSPFVFGGSSVNYNGADRLRGNIYTFANAVTITEITFELGISTATDVWFYVAESAYDAGPFFIVHESMVPMPADGQAFYSSGAIEVPVVTGRYYFIGIAWGDTNLDYFRADAALPRTWTLGTVEAMFQHNISEPPVESPFLGSIYDYGEFSMTLCFADVVFHDGFEVGDSSGWSTAVE